MAEMQNKPGLLPGWDREAVIKNRGWFMALAVFMILTGLAAIAVPWAAAVAIEILLGWVVLFMGSARLIQAFRSRPQAHFWPTLLGGLLYLAAGLLLLAYPLGGILTMALVLGGMLLAEGILKLAGASRLDGVPGRGWLAVNGALSILLGLLVIMGWPGSSGWLIGMLVGINLLFDGFTTLMMVTAAGKAA